MHSNAVLGWKTLGDDTIPPPLLSDVVRTDGKEDTLSYLGYIYTGLHIALPCGRHLVTFPYVSEQEIGILLDKFSLLRCVGDKVTRQVIQGATELVKDSLLGGATRINFYHTSKNFYRPVVFGECLYEGKQSKWIDFLDFYFYCPTCDDIRMGTSSSNPSWMQHIGNPLQGSRFILVQNGPDDATIIDLGPMYHIFSLLHNK